GADTVRRKAIGMADEHLLGSRGHRAKIGPGNPAGLLVALPAPLAAAPGDWLASWLFLRCRDRSTRLR
ncbi:MAG: hypothetical protein L6Q72_16095, partial [Burkholderiaceae bacterium]|nr:hypothetical protein [Burkholderiaceae bacterium]